MAISVRDAYSATPMLKYLRIAVTALSLTACVLLAALWMRSYWCVDCLAYSSDPGIVGLRSVCGTGDVFFVNNTLPSKWFFESQILAEAEIAWETPITWHHEPDYFSVSVQYWLLILLLTTVPLVTWGRSSWRFSLRTLLIATTLVAVGLGLIVYAARLRMNINDDGPVISLPSPAEWEAMTE